MTIVNIWILISWSINQYPRGFYSFFIHVHMFYIYVGNQLIPSEKLSSGTCGRSNKFSAKGLQHPGASFYQEFTGYISYFLPYWANNPQFPMTEIAFTLEKENAK